MKNLLLNLILVLGLTSSVPVLAQNQASNEFDNLVGMPLLDAHKQLLEKGYEIAQSSLFHKAQLWYNEDKNEALAFTFSKEGENNVETIKPGNPKKGLRGVRAARRVWANYRDGGSGVNSAGIDSQRDLLKGQGCSVSYWINDVSPGKTSEVWYNESKKICKMITWDTKTKTNVKIVDRDVRLGKNPAPVYDLNPGKF